MENCYFCQKLICCRFQSYMFAHLNKNKECLRIQKEYHQRREEEEQREEEIRLANLENNVGIFQKYLNKNI